MRQNASWMFHEQAEQRVFGCRQLNFTACARDQMRREIDDQIAIFEYGNFFGRPCFALRGAKACKQFRSANGLVM